MGISLVSSNLPLDTTLTKSGRAADAKAVGDNVSQLQSDISNEVSARESADASLQSDISNEVSARATADNALAARIDNLVVAAGGDNVTEVVDARVGVDGHTYTTLKSRLDSEVSSLLDRVKKISDSTTLSFNVSQSIGITSNKITTDIKKGERFYIKLDCDIESINLQQIWINDSFYTSSSVKNDWMTFTATKDIKTIHIVVGKNNVLKDTTVTLFVADKYSLIQLEGVSKNTFDIGKQTHIILCLIYAHV